MPETHTHPESCMQLLEAQLLQAVRIHICIHTEPTKHPCCMPISKDVVHGIALVTAFF